MKKSVLLLTTALILLIEPALALEEKENFGGIPIPHDPAALMPPTYDPATDPAMMATMRDSAMMAFTYDPATDPALMPPTYDPATDPAMMATMRDPAMMASTYDPATDPARMITMPDPARLAE